MKNSNLFEFEYEMGNLALLLVHYEGHDSEIRSNYGLEPCKFYSDRFITVRRLEHYIQILNRSGTPQYSAVVLDTEADDPFSNLAETDWVVHFIAALKKMVRTHNLFSTSIPSRIRKFEQAFDKLNRRL